MATRRAHSKTVAEYIARFPANVQRILQRIRRTIRRAAPDAEEAISYQIPAFRLKGILVWFAAAKEHIGFYPPIRGNVALARAAARYANENGSLRFPLDQPIPYELIERVTRHRVKQDREKAAKSATRRKAQ